LATAAVGGVAVFTARTAWVVSLSWPFLAGPAVGAVTFLTFGLMGQFDPGSASCGKDESNCNISMGFAAALLSIVTAVGLGVTFVVAHLIRRAISHAWARFRAG
jgi:hypothetical protein